MQKETKNDVEKDFGGSDVSVLGSRDCAGICRKRR